MIRKAKPIPDGYRSSRPYLVIKEAAEAIEYYKQVFDARGRLRINMPDG